MSIVKTGKGTDIQDRLVGFAISIIKLSTRLPKSREGRHVSGQLLRSGTSPAPNYAEARAAESKNDFVHKLRICLKELNETEIWLEIVASCNLMSLEKLSSVMQECTELCRIINASIKTIRKKE